jgi:uncharacterized membrane-anchored protein
MLRKHIYFLIALCSSLPMSAEQELQKAEDPSNESNMEMCESERKFWKLDWKFSGTYKLPRSGASLTLPKGYRMVLGEDSLKEAELLDSTQASDEVEAAIYDPSFDARLILDYVNCGYASIDDWADVDSVAFLKSMQEDTETANIKRKELGFDLLHVVGWLQEPTLDKRTNTVYWAIELLRSENGDKEYPIVNSVALRLGRYGYERILWATEKANYVSQGGQLDVILKAHSFDPGTRYEDHSVGDKIADYGVASLVAATIGAKALKVGGIAIFFKKFAGLVVVACAMAWGKIKKLFLGKSGT